MYRRESVGPRMNLVNFQYHRIFLWRFPMQNHPKLPLLKKRRNKAKYLTWNSIRLKFVKETSMSNSVESLGYIKCYSSSSPRPAKSYSNSIRHNCQKICSWFRRPLKPYWKSEKRSHSSRWSTILLFTSFSKTLLIEED